MVSCANPVVPDDWTVTHEPFIYVNDPFNFSLTIKPGVNLPTRPNFRIVQVTGQQRIDNELVVNNASEVEFFLHDPNQPDPNCLTGNNRCKKLITFPDMGVGENLVSGKKLVNLSFQDMMWGFWKFKYKVFTIERFVSITLLLNIFKYWIFWRTAFMFQWMWTPNVIF